MNPWQLKEEWISSAKEKAAIQAEIWDGMAKKFADKPLPKFSDHEFLKIMEKHTALTKQQTALDIGCGAGIYAMALAERLGKVFGTDVSPKMIQAAQERCAREGIKNAEFLCADWSALDIDALNWRKNFDIVFAHMTPAVDDYETLDKMTACSRSFCILQKPARRQDQILDAAFEHAGIPSKEEETEDTVISIFRYLWYHGYCPGFYYQDEVWEQDKTLDEMKAWCIGRAKLRKEIGSEEERAIADYLESAAVNQMIHETVKTTIVVIRWNV